MKILLIKPPLNPNMITTSLYEPLELEYLASSVKGETVKILDMRIDRNLKRELLNFRPDIAGITAYTTDYKNVIRILEEIKTFDSSVKTVIGGHHATFLPEDFAKPFVDAIFLGYADKTFPMYVNALDNPEKLSDIPNICLVKDGRIYYYRKESPSANLGTLPFPDRSLTAMYRKRYHDPMRNRLTLLMTSRGCPFRCSFCACWKLMDGKYASRTPESIVEELKTLPEENGIVYFSDDNTFHDIQRMWKLSALIKQNHIRKKFQMYARADTIIRHPELFAELKQSGLQFLTIGLESFNDSDLQKYNKKTSVEINSKAIRILKNLGIYIIAHFIVRPDYSKEDFRELYRYVSSHNLFRPAYPVLTPLPGTELYEQTSGSLRITDFDYFDFAHSVLPTKLPSREFYSQLTMLYAKSFSVSRIIKHRINRLAARKSEKYFTDNTDGLTVLRLLQVFFFTARTAIRLRYFRVNEVDTAHEN